MTASALRLTPRRPVRWAILALPLGFLLVYFAWPLVALLGRAVFGEPLGDASTTLDGARLARVTLTTLSLATAGTVLALAIGLPATWALFRLRWRGRRIARAVLSAPFAMPTVVVAAAFSALLRPSGALGWLNASQSWGAIAVALAFFNVAVVLRVVGGTWEGLDPGTLAAARTLGASRAQAFRHVTLPALASAIGAAAAVVFLFSATSFGVVLVLGGTRISTVETEIWIQVNQFLDLRAAAVLAAVQGVIVIASLGIAAWARRRRERVISAKRRDGTRPVTSSDIPWAVAALTPAVFLLALPMGALGQRALTGPDGFTLDHVASLVGGRSGGALSVPLWEATLNSFEAAVIATLLAVSLGLIAAWGLTHARRPGWVDGVIMLPLGVSAVLVGLGALLTLRSDRFGPVFGDPRWLIPAAQAVVAMPLVVRGIMPTLRAIDPKLRRAAAILGAGPWRTWREVDWPAVRRPLLLAAGLAAAVSLGEFGATSFLARPDHPTLPTAIFRLLSRPGADNIGSAFAASLLLAAITAGIMIVAERFRGSGEAEV